MKESQVCKLPAQLERAVNEIDQLLASGAKALALDFQDVTFITVDGLEWLEELLMHAQSQAAQLKFVNVQPEQYKLFKVAHIPGLLEACGAAPISGPAC